MHEPRILLWEFGAGDNATTSIIFGNGIIKSKWVEALAGRILKVIAGKWIELKLA